jgi:NTE family protein
MADKDKKKKKKSKDKAKAKASPTIALALGGGGARGIAHIPVLEALDELGLTPVAINGSSIGAIMGAGRAAGLTGRDIREYTLATVGNRSEVINRLWKLRPANMRKGFRFGQFNLERILRAFMPDAIPDDFAQLTIPLQVTVTDYYGQRGLLIGEGELFPALAASAAIPALFMPVTMEGRVMIDGGIFDPVPYETLIGKADIVIGVDVVGAPEGDGITIPNRIDSLFGASQLMMQSLIATKMRSNPPDILLRPEVNRFRVLDFMRAGEVLEAAAGVKDELKRLIDAEIAFRQKD